MGRLELFLPDDLEQRIKAKGAQPEDLILSLLRDYFSRQDQIKTEGEPKNVLVPTPTKEQETKIPDYETERIAVSTVKEFLEKAKDTQTSVQKVFEAHKETEKLIDELERTVKSAEEILAKSKEIQGKPQETPKRISKNQNENEH